MFVILFCKWQKEKASLDEMTLEKEEDSSAIAEDSSESKSDSAENASEGEEPKAPQMTVRHSL